MRAVVRARRRCVVSNPTAAAATFQARLNRFLSTSARPCTDCNCSANSFNVETTEQLEAESNDQYTPHQQSRIQPQPNNSANLRPPTSVQHSAPPPASSSTPTDSSVDSSTSTSTARQRCDPYEQNGLPLSDAVVQQLITTLQPGWYATAAAACTTATLVSSYHHMFVCLMRALLCSAFVWPTRSLLYRQYDASKKLLSKTISFRPPATSVTTSTSAFASSPSPSSSSSAPSTAASLSALFQLVTSVGVVAVNTGHSPYQLSVVPRKLHVVVQLHTIALHGLSYADFQLATHIDGLEMAGRRQWNIRQPQAHPPTSTAAMATRSTAQQQQQQQARQ